MKCPLVISLISLLLFVTYVSSQLALDNLVSKTSKFALKLDEAKEEATKCRFVVMVHRDMNVIKRLTGDQLDTINQLLPQMVQDCYLSIENLIEKRLQQLGPIMTPSKTSNPEVKPNKVQTSTHKIKIGNNQWVSLDQYKDLVLYERFSNGSDIWAQLTTGVLGDFYAIVNSMIFNGPINSSLGPKSPLKSLETFEKESPKSDKFSLLDLLKIVKDARYVDGLPSVDMETLKSIVGDSPECEWEEIFIMQKLYSIQPVGLQQQAHKITQACLRNLDLAKQFEWTPKSKLFAQKLLEFLGNKHLQTNTNLLNHIDPRNLGDNRLELNFFFNPIYAKAFKGAGMDLKRVYENGKDVCEKFNEINYTSSETFKKLIALFGIHNFYLGLENGNDNENLQFFLVAKMCLDIDLINVKINDKHFPNLIDIHSDADSDIHSDSDTE